VQVLFLHDADIRTAIGGAEITQRTLMNNPPEGVTTSYANYRDVTRALIDETDKIVIGNMFTTEFEAMVHTLDLIQDSGTPYIKSEHDFMLCGVGRLLDCVTLQSPTDFTVGSCACPESKHAELARRLHHGADRVRYLSPMQRSIFSHFGYDGPSFLAAPPIDYGIFKSTIPWGERPEEAMVVGNHDRGPDIGEANAKSDGLRVSQIVGKERTPEQLAEAYNQHKYLYLFPRTIHTFCRQAAEAHACGCKVVASNRVGALSYGGMDEAIAASKRGAKTFWDNVLP
jgi:hypothetical protein